MKAVRVGDGRRRLRRQGLARLRQRMQCAEVGQGKTAVLVEGGDWNQLKQEFYPGC